VSLSTTFVSREDMICQYRSRMRQSKAKRTPPGRRAVLGSSPAARDELEARKPT
jgi:hypothetical protein